MFRPWIKSLINLIYPLTCLICGIKLDPLSQKPLCAVCWSKIEYNPAPFCRVCGKPLPACPAGSPAGRPARHQSQALVCQDCQNSQFYFKQVRSVCKYDGVIKECIHLFKYNHKLSLTKPLGGLLVDFATHNCDMSQIDLILPVPLHSKKLRQRQFNHAQNLAQSLAAAFSKQIQPQLIVKIKPGPDQVSLTRAARSRNIRGAFTIRNNKPVKSKNVLLVDDVFTTGATVNECAKALLDAGAKQVDVLTLARGT
ncbi:double zinc ribbon domain-containing protein [Candidatus Omnitrophota bacterium]